MSDDELEAAGINLLPGSLGDAIELFANSELMKEVLGEHIHSYYAVNKLAEWNEYRTQVSEWELDRYLSTI